MLTDASEVTIDKAQLKVLASDTRIEILKLLTKRNYTVSELAKKLNYSKSTLHEHIRKLEESGLIERVNSGYAPKWVYYRLTSKGMQLFDKTRRIVLIVAGLFVILAFAQLAVLLFQNFSLEASRSIIKAPATQTKEYEPASESVPEGTMHVPPETTRPLAPEPIEAQPSINWLMYGAAACFSIGLMLFLYAAARQSKIILRKAHK
ncbi:MAG: metalloregulator ArsR/SmtB family transcription factor [Candidatus Diapherotrites archaeon]|nr:metalloregulator ArsR/SmtB family transcription factor [Candidatus Diapherotrites archaeon]